MKAKKQNHPKKYIAPPKKHSRGNSDYKKVYWPFLPLIILSVLGFAIGFWWKPPIPGGVLSYATEMSTGGLLEATNDQRVANGANKLTINSKLSQAAQNKANDMVNRDYWSHNTPDGQEPWVFIDAVDYSYSKAGENLAYGFATSSATVSGWMNSPTHRANMLDTSFTEVGFGYINGSNFVNTGQETIVVAMYAKPLVKSTQQPSAPPAPSATVANDQTPAEAPIETPSEDLAASESQSPPAEPVPTTTDTLILGDEEQVSVSRAQQLTGGKLPWIGIALSFVGGVALAVWIMKHGLAIRRMLASGESFVIHHPVIDVIIFGVIAAVVILSQSVGVIK